MTSLDISHNTGLEEVFAINNPLSQIIVADDYPAAHGFNFEWNSFCNLSFSDTGEARELNFLQYYDIDVHPYMQLCPPANVAHVASSSSIMTLGREEADGYFQYTEGQQSSYYTIHLDGNLVTTLDKDATGYELDVGSFNTGHFVSICAHTDQDQYTRPGSSGVCFSFYDEVTPPRS